jgi:LCP family protein required for cell wall assembly
MLVPGAGQVYLGALRLGLLLLTATTGLLVVGALLATRAGNGFVDRLVDRRVVAGLVAVNLALLALRLFAVADAWRRGQSAAPRLAVAGLAALAAVTALPHVAAGFVAVRGYTTLTRVFASEEPKDVLPARGLFIVPERSTPIRHPVWPGGVPPAADPPARIRRGDLSSKPLTASRRVLVLDERPVDRPWTTLLLLGSDRGPGNWGERTDTMIVVAFQRGTRRAVLFGVPRNWVEVPLGGDAPSRFHEPLNALYSFGRAHPELFPGGRDAGGTALKQTISRLLGIRIDYYALVDLLGFADLVDALGGVDVHVNERLLD